MGKIAILYAAFQLRDDVRTAMSQPGVTKDNIDAKLRAMWTQSCVPGLTFAAGRPPHLSRIFDFGLNPVDFAGIETCGVSETFEIDDATTAMLQPAHELEYTISKSRAQYVERWATLLNFEFAQQLWMMTRWSDNAAATLCGYNIGLPHVFALLCRSGLYQPTGSGTGLRIVKLYEDPPHWDEFQRLADPKWQSKLPAFRAIIQPTGDADFKYLPELNRIQGGDVQASTVTALASLMAGLVSQTLINSEASQKMATFLRLIPRTGIGLGINSYIVKALQNPDSAALLTDNNAVSPIQFSDVWSKLGVDDATFVDWAYLVPVPGRRLGMIVLGYQSDHRNSQGDWASPFDDVRDPFNDAVRSIAIALLNSGG